VQLQEDALGGLKEANTLRKLATVNSVAAAVEVRVTRIASANDEREPEVSIRVKRGLLHGKRDLLYCKRGLLIPAYLRHANLSQ